jgi:hypothetical protein
MPPRSKYANILETSNPFPLSEPRASYHYTTKHSPHRCHLDQNLKMIQTSNPLPPLGTKSPITLHNKALKYTYMPFRSKSENMVQTSNPVPPLGTESLITLYNKALNI